MEKELQPKKTSALKKPAKSAPKESAQANIPPQIAEVRAVQRKRKIVHVEIDTAQVCRPYIFIRTVILKH